MKVLLQVMLLLHQRQSRFVDDDRLGEGSSLLLSTPSQLLHSFYSARPLARTAEKGCQHFDGIFLVNTECQICTPGVLAPISSNVHSSDSILGGLLELNHRSPQLISAQVDGWRSDPQLSLLLSTPFPMRCSSGEVCHREFLSFAFYG